MLLEYGYADAVAIRLPSIRNWTEEQVDHFLEHGYIVIKGAFTPEKAAEWTKDMWARLGMDPNDKSTWDRERIHMPSHRRETVASFAPKVSFPPFWRAPVLAYV